MTFLKEMSFLTMVLRQTTLAKIALIAMEILFAEGLFAALPSQKDWNGKQDYPLYGFFRSASKK